MTVVAFIFDDYDCCYPQNAFKGPFHNHEEAKKLLKGERYCNNNLAIMDIDTLGWEVYYWLPLFNVREVDGKIYLKHRWDTTQEEFEIVYDSSSDVIGYGHHNMHYEAGEWRYHDQI